MMLLLAAGTGIGQAAQAGETARGEETARITAVVELFTSQGCSSCPPADQVLSTFAERPDTLALAWHVDYWNYLGWRDTFSDAAFSERQRGYARRMEGGVFTPQVVVNGAAQTIGSRGPDVARMARDARSMPLLPLRVHREGGRLRGTLAGTAAERAAARGALLVLVRYERRVEVSIARGENSGLTTVYRNVVRDARPVGRVEEGGLDVLLDADAAAGPGRALVLQAVEDDAPGPILAATVLP